MGMTRSILVADDDAVSRELVASVLENNGYTVSRANDGAEALTGAKANRPDLVVADLLMPVMDGYELANAIRRDTEIGSTPVILYTATYTEVEAQSLAADCGASAVLTKPIDPKELLASVAGALDSNESASRALEDFEQKHRQLLISKLLQKVGELKHTRMLMAEEAMGRLVSILEATPDMVGILNAADGVPVYINPAGRRMLGIPLEEDIRSLRISQFHPEWALEIVEREALPGAARSGAWTGETSLMSRAGNEIPVSQVVLAHKSAAGEVEYFSTIARDVSAVKRLEEQLRRSQKMEAIGRLAGGVAHEFNNMLTVILGHTALLAGVNLDSELQLSVTSIQQAAERASSLTTHLLAFSRKQIRQVRTLNLNQLIDGMGGLFSRTIEEIIDVRTILAPGLGRVRADAAQIEQAIMNLVLNARDAMPDGGRLNIETCNIDLESETCRGRLSVPAGRYVRLSIVDEGRGMDSTTLSHLFEPFFSTKPMGQATGLGLATVYGIVQQSSGYITVYSEIGMGTTFRIYLPRLDGWTGKLPTLAAGGTETILLVDDDEQVRRAIRSSLEKRGYNILEASGSAEAMHVSRAYTNTIDILIVDLVLKHSVAADLVAMLAAARPAMQILYMSGYGRDSAVNLGLLPAGAEYIEKPFSLNSLAERVRNILDTVRNS